MPVVRPLLVLTQRRGPLGVGELADWIGRNSTTVSRQVAKLESLGLIARRAGKTDRGVTEAVVTETVGNAGRGSRAGGREGARGLEGA